VFSCNVTAAIVVSAVKNNACLCMLKSLLFINSVINEYLDYVNYVNKIRLHKTSFKPILCYESVTWTLTQTTGQMLITFERKILRRICCPTQEEGRWRSRWNSELYSLYNEPNIVEDIKIRKLGLEVHIIRMEEERIPKKVLNGNFYTTRPVGRPKPDGRMWY